MKQNSTTQHSTDSQNLTSQQFADKARNKIRGWYKQPADEDRAVNRMVTTREEIISLLGSIPSEKAARLLAYLDESGFYYRPSSAKKHHNFPGGLAEHSLGIFRILDKWNTLSPEERRTDKLYTHQLAKLRFSADIFHAALSRDEMLLASIGHDLCKAQRFWFDGRTIRMHHESNTAHSALSESRMKKSGFNHNEEHNILLAIRTHMRLFEATDNPDDKARRAEGRKSHLAVLVWAADKLDSSRHPAGR